MNVKWVFVGLLAISCGNHSPTVAKSNLPTQDTLRAAPVDMPKAVPVMDTGHPASRAPGHSLCFTTDLNNDQIPDTISIVSSSGDTATFDTVHISIASFGRRTFHSDTDHPWTNVDDDFPDAKSNAVPTNKFFLARGRSQSVVLLFGDLSPAGYRDNFSIIDIEDNEPKLVLNQNDRHLYIEAPISLTDLDGDGRLDFLYRQIFEYNGQPDTPDGKVGAYSPYLVYTVDNNCVLNQSLTIRYNKEHYVFAGFKYDESIEVFYPNDSSQPRLWK